MFNFIRKTNIKKHVENAIDYLVSNPHKPVHGIILDEEIPIVENLLKKTNKIDEVEFLVLTFRGSDEAKGALIGIGINLPIAFQGLKNGVNYFIKENNPPSSDRKTLLNSLNEMKNLLEKETGIKLFD